MALHCSEQIAILNKNSSSNITTNLLQSQRFHLRTDYLNGYKAVFNSEEIHQDMLLL